MKSTETKLNLIQRALQFIDLENFVDALKLTHLVELIKSGGPFTLFAPINTAFSNIQEPVFSVLQEDENLLSTLIQHHVVPGKYKSTDLVIKPELRSLIGGTLYASSGKGHLWINEIQIIRGDLEAANGILHIVDGLLLPDAVTRQADKLISTMGASHA